MSASTIVLRTACGCERIVDAYLEGPRRPEEFRVPMRNSPKFWLDYKDAANELVVPMVRSFKYNGHRPSDGMPVYDEVGDVPAKKPDVAQVLTSGEWADAVSVWSAATEGDMPKADADFKRRHDGASILVHARTGVLVGAFYEAPSWSCAADAVALFNAVRRIYGE